ncbi:hypothetical protein MIMGU_mgv1a0212492mg, partial [Erythranthe guttata]
LSVFDHLPFPLLWTTMVPCASFFSSVKLSKFELKVERTDQSCTDLLDSQPSKSMIYLSFGRVTVLTRDQFMEVWYGLVNNDPS